MQLDVSSLESAIAKLEKYFEYLHSDRVRSDDDVRDAFRTAAVKAFEYVYELTHKMIRRQLEQIVTVPSELREVTFTELMRQAAEAGLVQDVGRWRNYREMRNETSHTYNQDFAEKIAAEIGPFLDDARFTLKELQRRNADAD